MQIRAVFMALSILNPRGEYMFNNKSLAGVVIRASLLATTIATAGCITAYPHSDYNPNAAYNCEQTGDNNAGYDFYNEYHPVLDSICSYEREFHGITEYDYYPEAHH